MTGTEETRSPRVPPRWFVRGAWRVHRGLYKLSRGRFLWTTSNKRGWGALRLTTLGRRSAQERSVIVGYVEDGADLVLLAMNGWDAPEPAWWLNLQAHPGAVVELAGGTRREVRGRAAVGADRERLWERWRELDANLDGFAARRPRETAVVVLEPARAD